MTRRVGRRIGRVLAAASAFAMVLGIGATGAAADVVAPAGNCVGTGTWQDGGERGPFTEDSRQLAPGDTVKIPLKDTITWKGWLPRLVNLPPEGEPPPLGTNIEFRQIRGKVEIELPPPIGWVTVDDWGVKVTKPSQKVVNEGEHEYDFPSVLAGVKVPVRGEHFEGSQLYCSGSAKVQFEGSLTDNPAALAGLGGLVVSGGLLLYSGKPVVKKLWAYEDTHE
jgi:hypothetical protein